jgi:hypothetical protein
MEPRTQAAYDVPSAAGGDAGLEGFSVEAGGRRAGRVAALNRSGDGLVVVVDTGDSYRAISAERVLRIEALRRAVVLTTAGEEELAASPAVDARILGFESPRLVRHVPRQLDRLMVEGEPAPRQSGRSRKWVLGSVLAVVGGVAVFVGAPLTAESVGGSLRAVWVAVPAATFVAGVSLLWRSLDSGEGRRLSWAEKAGDAVTAVLGVSPRTRKRG